MVLAQISGQEKGLQEQKTPPLSRSSVRRFAQVASVAPLPLLIDWLYYRRNRRPALVLGLARR